MRPSALVWIVTLAACAEPDDGGAGDPGKGDDIDQTGALVESVIACDLEGIRMVEVPADYSRPMGTRLALKYRVFPSPAAGAPTVVVVPGGPGGDIMRTSPSDSFALGAVPLESFNVVYTDVRGSGCNSYGALPDSPEDVYTIENTSRDLLAIIQQEELSDYLLYGASYGTAQVTVATSIAEDEGVHLPRRVILEGTVGHAFDSFDAYFEAFSSEWIRTKLLLEPAWAAAFETEPWPAELVWSRAQWGAFVSSQIILGDLPGSGPILKHWLDLLSQQDPAAQAFVSRFMNAAAAPATLSTLFRTIACHELWGSWRLGREIRLGALGATGEDECDGVEKDRPFDSDDWQLSVPVTYFHGPHDPTTTTAQAEYHFDHHQGVARQFVVVPDASHASLTLGLAGRGCSADVWRALASDPDGLATVLADCTAPGEPEIGLTIGE